MKKILSGYFILIVLWSASYCSFLKPEPITDDMVVRYIRAYKKLKAMGPDMVNRMNEGGDVDQAQAGFKAMEDVIKEAGFSSYAEFVKVNAAIGMAFSQIQGREFMKKMGTMQSAGNEEIMKSLADPNVPEETKAELRKAQEKIASEMKKNMPIAEGVLGFTEKISSLFSDTGTMDVVRRHSKELEEAFAGTKIPSTEFFRKEL